MLCATPEPDKNSVMNEAIVLEGVVNNEQLGRIGNAVDVAHRYQIRCRILLPFIYAQ